MKRSPLKRSTPLRSTTSLDRTTRLAKVNVEATKRRKKRQRKQWASKHDQAVRAEALARAKGQCEYSIPTEGWEPHAVAGCTHYRCPATEGLEAHHLRYPKSRPLAARDLQVLCDPHHNYVEATQHPTRAPRRRAAGL